MTRTDKIAVLSFGMVLASIVSICWLVNPKALFAVDQGWATLIAAGLGFAAIAYQTRVGFENLKRSAIEQSRQDREAREHQAALQRSIDIDRERRAAKSLASTLAAEITATGSQLSVRVSVLNSYVEIYEKMGNGVPGVATIAELLPSFATPAFKANVGNLGLLGPSVAHDVVQLYTRLADKPYGDANLLSGKQISPILRTWERMYMAWLEDQNDVVLRLLAIVSGDPDPGALVETRAKRATAARLKD